MPGFSTDYPITEEVRSALLRYPNIASALDIKSESSPLQIIRILGNTHYDHLVRLLGFIENALPSAGNIGKRVLEQTSRFSFCQSMAELYMLQHLQKPAGHTAAPAKRSKHYDIDLDAGGITARIEVYCPVDFFSAQLSMDAISDVFKYLPVGRGFHIEVTFRTTDPMNYSFAYDVGNEDVVQNWLNQLRSSAVNWLNKPSPNTAFEMDGPSGDMVLHAKIVLLIDEPGDRLVIFNSPTKSTDTRLFFEMGTVVDTAQSQWGLKISRKLEQRQCGSPESGIIRVLIVDFSQADTGWPDFICWPKIATRIQETITLLADKAGEPIPYDVVIPAQLDIQCCFGTPAVVSDQLRDVTEALISSANLAKPCEPPNRSPADWLTILSA